MATIQIVNVSQPNDGLGDKLRTSQVKANGNFAELNDKKVEKQQGRDLSDVNFSLADKQKLDSIQAGAETNIQSDFLIADTTQDGFIKNKPPGLFTSVGSLHYADLETQTTPFTTVANVAKKLNNDALGSLTNIANAPYGISTLWNSVGSFFIDLTQLSIGDLVNLRVDMLITPSAINSQYRVFLKMAIGSAEPWELTLVNSDRKLATEFQINDSVNFDIARQSLINFPSELWIETSVNTTIKIKGWYFNVIRKGLNLVTVSNDKSLQLISKYNATTNLPYLDNATPSIRDVYEVSVGGSRDFGAGNIVMNPKDFIIKNTDGQWILFVNNNQSAAAFVRPAFDVFKFIQKGFGNVNLNINEIGDIFCGWSNDGSIRITEAVYLGGALTSSANFTPLVPTGFI